MTKVYVISRWDDEYIQPGEALAVASTFDKAIGYIESIISDGFFDYIKGKRRVCLYEGMYYLVEFMDEYSAMIDRWNTEFVITAMELIE